MKGGKSAGPTVSPDGAGAGAAYTREHGAPERKGRAA
jgi:hypothetical protein